ncbi:THAP-type domain-containing protein [Trichonephila clavata]|uniref:THAP-type domain-containing protein n=1 Tax=Trichonephila clavata TaxID=2740835 RepID=A0A8X6KQ38_TRICU|nr:THAP-type domain-containing protein [Trichonephila clavata]
MRSYCCIPNCNSSSVDKEPGLSFHEFPTKNHYRNRWLKAITTLVTSDFRLNERMKNKVCSKHFKETDFSPLCSKRRRLKGCAVPSVFPESINKFPDQSHARVISVDSEEPENCASELTDSEVSLEILEHENFSNSTCTTSELDVIYESKNVCNVLKCEKSSSLDLSLNNSVDGLKRISAKESNLSEFTVFGLYVASQLQQLPLEDAYRLKEKIQTLLTRFCPQSLKEPTFFSYIPEDTTNVTNDKLSLESKLFVSKESKKHASYPSSQTYVPTNMNSSFKIYTLTQTDFLNPVCFNN